MQKLVDAAKDYIRALFAENTDGHGFRHSMRVYRNALLILEAEPEADRLVVSLGALLHDADDHKLFRTENNANARRFLRAKMGISVPERPKAGLSRMPTGWTPSAPSELPGRSPTAGNMEGRRRIPSRISMKSFSC